MATVLGKRKSRVQKPDPSISQEEVQAKLAKFFEAKFKPLFPTAKQPKAGSEIGEGADEDQDDDDDDEEGIGSGSSDSDDDSWDGCSNDGEQDEADDDDDDDETSPAVEVVEVISHTDTYSTAPSTKNALADKRESRAWLSSRPPLPISKDDTPSSSNKKKNKATTTAEEDAPSLLKNDLALQRLLSESHLFSSAAAKSKANGDDNDPTEHAGRNRHLATDLRLSALGSKTSIYAQAKMPMRIRKGMRAAAESKEEKRRREARENGVVLERASGKKGGSFSSFKGGRRRGGGGGGGDIDAPDVGRLRNGTLTLSKRDIASVEGGGGRGARGGLEGGLKRRRRR